MLYEHYNINNINRQGIVIELPGRLKTICLMKYRIFSSKHFAGVPRRLLKPAPGREQIYLWVLSTICLRAIGTNRMIINRCFIVNG